MCDSGLIIIEGNIGAGKSTFAKELANALNGEYIPEPDETTNPYLADYYKDPARWAFDIQMFLLSRRFRAQKYAQSLVRHKGGFVVMDRSYYGDVCFANVQHQLGYFSDRDYHTYLAHHTDMKVSLEPPKALIYLDAAPDVCLKRISKRLKEKTGRECEAGIELDYLERLREEIRHLVYSLSDYTYAHEIKWNDEKTPEEIKQKALNIAKALKANADNSVYDYWIGKDGIGV